MSNFPTNSWNPFFLNSKSEGLFDKITARLQEDRRAHKTIFPPSTEIFRAFELCDLDRLSVVILGQDPYHGQGEANGLCFSVHPEVRNPPSLRNIFKELKLEYPDFDLNRSSDLSDWAEQGVLLINSVLTVQKDLAASHSDYGWQVFTDQVIAEISSKKGFTVFLLFGNFAKTKIPLIDAEKHCILTAAHPSPFSAYKGFFGSNVFVECNKALIERGLEAIRW